MKPTFRLPAALPAGILLALLTGCMGAYFPTIEPIEDQVVGVGEVLSVPIVAHGGGTDIRFGYSIAPGSIEGEIAAEKNVFAYVFDDPGTYQVTITANVIRTRNRIFGPEVYYMLQDFTDFTVTVLE